MELLKGRKKLAKLGAHLAYSVHILYILYTLGNGHSAVLKKKMLMIKCCGAFILISCVSCCYVIVGDHFHGKENYA